MKAVMISIQPKYCEFIANGKKTVEVRKTRPKIETTFKVYIYCTTSKSKEERLILHPFGYELGGIESSLSCRVNGKVIGEFVCDRVREFRVFKNGLVQDFFFEKLEHSCLSYDEIVEYIGRNKVGYSWHISNLVIYVEPKELSEFYRLGNPLICDGRNCENCNHLKYMQVNSDEWDYDCDCQHQLENRITLKRPPQSWCYMEEVQE